MARIVKEKEYTERRNTILDVTQQLVYSKGYDSMAIQDILEELQISKGAFYHYFDSKQALLEALLERMVEEMKQVLLPIVEDPDLPCLEKFQRFFSTISRWKVERKGFLLGMVQTWYADDNAIARHRAQMMVLRDLSPLLAEVIKQGVQGGELTTSYPNQIAGVILGMLNNFSRTLGEILFVHELDQDELLQRVKEIIDVYTDALERILGAPTGSLCLVEFEQMKEWRLSWRESV